MAYAYLTRFDQIFAEDENRFLVQLTSAYKPRVHQRAEEGSLNHQHQPPRPVTSTRIKGGVCCRISAKERFDLDVA
ncbi:MAG: hypothetical protein M3115_01725 [Thermoproteota archaeon]|nr:hypothetical protein [Thermoproteota archaeon]